MLYVIPTYSSAFYKQKYYKFDVKFVRENKLYFNNIYV